MWNPSFAWWEFVLRGAIIYVFLLLLLRVTGKRQVGELSPFDLILLLILSDGVQNAVNAGDTSITGGLIIATTLILLNHIVGLLAYRHRRFESWIDGKPEVVIRNGKVTESVMRRQHISQMELESAVRLGGCQTIADVKLAILETNGHISVFGTDLTANG